MPKLSFVLLFLPIFLLTSLLTLVACSTTNTSSQVIAQEKITSAEKIQVGAQRKALYLPKLQGKRVGLVVNQTSVLANEQGKPVHLVDFLLAQGVKINYIFAPEHGFRGDHDAGAKVASNIDAKTGIPVVSIYGKTRKPSSELMQNLDVIIFDIQDVGVRFYTYISSMHYVMEAASDAGVEFMVLDRPNPNIAFVDGPMLEPKFRSFVGLDTIPLLHGMTVGELAKMIQGEGWLKLEKPLQSLKLTVIPVANYTRHSAYSLPVKPSPNLPNDVAIALYPDLGFFEATTVSVGRGTPFPFQVYGHNKVKLGEFTFMPVSTPGAALKPKLMGQQLYGVDLRNSSQGGLPLTHFYNAYQKFKKAGVNFINRPAFLDKLAGTDRFRKALTSGKTLAQIKQSWQPALQEFLKQRQPYLIYK